MSIPRWCTVEWSCTINSAEPLTFLLCVGDDSRRAMHFEVVDAQHCWFHWRELMHALDWSHRAFALENVVVRNIVRTRETDEAFYRLGDFVLLARLSLLRGRRDSQCRLDQRQRSDMSTCIIQQQQKKGSVSDSNSPDGRT